MLSNYIKPIVFADRWIFDHFLYKSHLMINALLLSLVSQLIEIPKSNTMILLDFWSLKLVFDHRIFLAPIKVFIE